MSTAMDMQKYDRERQARMFEIMIEAFLKNWAPDDRERTWEFERDLHALVRQIYRDAQEPLLDHISKIVGSMPMVPTHLWPKS